MDTTLIKLISAVTLCLLVEYSAAQVKASPDLESHYQTLFDEYGLDFSQYKGTGFTPYYRLKHFMDSRKVNAARSASAHRLEVYKGYFSGKATTRGNTPVANWVSVGPDKMETYSGRVISYAFDPVDPNKLWVGSASGGLWMSENLGDNWQPMTDEIPSTGVGAIAVHPDNPEILLIGTGEGFTTTGVIIKPGMGIFKSTDGGDTWSETSFNVTLQADVSIMDLVWHPTNYNIIWAAATNGLWKSENGGEDWSFELGDGTNHGNFIIDDIIIQQDDPTIMYIAIEGKGIYKSVNSGASFDLLTNGLPASDLNIIKVSQCDAAPEVLYTSIIKASDFSLMGLYKTIDAGVTWTKLDNAPNAPCSPQALGFCQGWYNNFVSVSPLDPLHVYFGGVTMWQSKNGGLTWTQKDRLVCPNCAAPPPCTMYADFHAFGFSPHDEDLLFSFNDGGVARSLDGGECFEDVNNELRTAQFLAISSSRLDPNVVIGGMQDHGLQGMDFANGLNWYRWGWFDGSDVEVHSNDASIFYGTWFDGTYWKFRKGIDQYALQINAGMNLNENTSTYFAPLAVDPDDGDILLGSTQQRLYRSTNEGASWTPVLTAVNISDIRFSEADPDFAYAASWTGTAWKFYRSEDNGANWTETMSSPGWRVTDIRTSTTEPLTVYATRNSINANIPHVYKSVDGGETWQGIQGDLPDITINALALDHFNPEVLFVASDLGIFVSENDGINWNLFNDGMPVTYVYDLEFNPTDTSLVAGTLGRGAYKTKLSGEVFSSVSSSPQITFTVYPNPVRQQVNILFGERISGDVEIHILNALGQRVAATEQQILDGKQLIIDLSKADLNKGVYYIELIKDHRSTLRKIVVTP